MDLSLLQQFGAELRQAREASGRSVDEIARQTRIHRRYIEAIEAGDGDALPPGPYVPAFLREFARAVGLKVPQELAITSSINHGLTTATVQSAPIVKNTHAANPLGVVSKAADETAKFAGNVAKTAVKTTGTVIKGVGEGINDTAGFLTSRSLREEAELVRRERLGLEKFPEPAAANEVEPEAIAAESAATEVVSADASTIENTEAPHFERLSETQPKKGRSIKAPILPLEISSEDPVAGEATLKLGKTSKKFPVTNVVIILLLIAFGLIAYFAIGNMKEKKRGDVVQNSELSNEEDLPTVTSTPDKTPAQAEPAPAVTAPVVANDSLQFVLRATDSVWVSIGSDEGTPFRGKLAAGETKTFTAADRFVVNIGNQKALEMTFNGTRLSNLPTIKNSGMVVRNLVLTKDKVSLNGSDVNTSGGVTPVATATETKPAETKSVAPSTKSVAKPVAPVAKSATPLKKPATTTDKKPTSTTTTVRKATTTTPSTAVKKPVTTTPKKPVASTTKKAAPKKTTTIQSVDPVPAAAD